MRLFQMVRTVSCRQKNSVPSDILIFGGIIFLKLLVFNLFIDGSITSLAYFASVLGTVLILVCWANLLSGRARWILLYIIDSAVTFLIIADMLYYRYFSNVLSLNILTQASVVTSVKSSVFSLIHMSDIIFILDLLLIPLCLIIGSRFNKSVRTSCRNRIIRTVFALAIGIGLCRYGIMNLLETQPNIFKSFYDKVYIVQNIGLLSFHSIDAFKFIESKNKEALPVTEDKKQEIKEFFGEMKVKTPEAPEFFGIGKDKNLIVVQVEALQEFVINRSINGKEITPNLNKLIKSSIYFDNYYTETAGGGTSDAELLSNVSLFPVREGSTYIRFSGNDYYSLAGKMSEHGYMTSAMHAFRPGFWNRSVMYQTLRFDRFVSKDDYVEDEISGMGLTDKSFFRQSLEYMEKQKEPYYTLLITLTSHYPFDNDKKYYGSFDVGKYKDTFFGNYLEAIHYADEALGEFISELEAKGLMDRSVLAVYGDHFAIPNDKKEYLADFLQLGKMNEYNWIKQQRVPLIIRLPGGEGSGIRHIAGGGVDFMPTVLNIMGVDGSNVPMLGRDLLNSQEGIAVLRHGYFITDKYICLTSKGVAYDAESGSSHPIEELEGEIKLSARLLEYSDAITENNLTKELIEYLEEK